MTAIFLRDRGAGVVFFILGDYLMLLLEDLKKIIGIGNEIGATPNTYIFYF